MTVQPSKPAPDSFVRRWGELVSAGGRVLDLACGNGRNGRWFLERGHPVTFVDRDIGEVLDVATGEIVAADLESDPWPFGDERFAAVVVVNYLWRPLLPRLLTAVAPEGILLYATFGAGNEAYGRPRRPEFLLQDGELLDVVAEDAGLRVACYEAGVEELGNGPRVRQRICAVRGETWRIPPVAAIE